LQQESWECIPDGLENRGRERSTVTFWKKGKKEPKE